MKISVITVCYNSEKFIKHCIESVNTQLYENIEHIFIDGLSSDNTISIIKNSSKQQKVLISERDNGIYDAMNKGLKICSGDIVCFLNSDDFFSNDNVLDEIVKSFNESQNQLVWGNINLVHQNNLSKVIRKINPGPLNKKSLLLGRVPAHPSFFMSKKIADAVGFHNLKYDVAADFDFMKRALMETKYKGKYLNLTTTIQRSGGYSGQFSNIVRGNLQIVDSLKKTYSNFGIIAFLFAKFKQKTTDYLRALFT